MSDEFDWSGMVESVHKTYPNASYAEIDSWCRYTWDTEDYVSFEEYKEMVHAVFNYIDPHI